MDPIDRRYLDFSPQNNGLSLDMTGVRWVQARRILRMYRTKASGSAAWINYSLCGVGQGLAGLGCWYAALPLRMSHLERNTGAFLWVVERSPCRIGTNFNSDIVEITDV